MKEQQKQQNESQDGDKSDESDNEKQDSEKDSDKNSEQDSQDSGQQDSQQVLHFFSPALCEFSFHRLQLLLIIFCFFRRILPAKTVWSFELEGYFLSSLHLSE